MTTLCSIAASFNPSWIDQSDVDVFIVLGVLLSTESYAIDFSRNVIFYRLEKWRFLAGR